MVHRLNLALLSYFSDSDILCSPIIKKSLIRIMITTPQKNALKHL